MNKVPGTCAWHLGYVVRSISTSRAVPDTQGVPRSSRVSQPGLIHHVVAHGVDMRALFSDDLDHGRFVNILAEVSQIHDWHCLAFCLMTTHYHLLVEERESPLSKVMHLVNSRYSWHVNARFARRGHVFEGRYRDRVVTGEPHLLEAIRYIARNPCNAGICSAPEAWRWSSYPALIGVASPWSFVHASRVLAWFAPAREPAIQCVREFVNKVPGTAPGTLVTRGGTRR